VVTIDIGNWEHVSIRPWKIGDIWSKDLVLENEAISVDYPLAWSFVGSPIEVSGEAKGYWFFEGDFPVILNDNNGNVLATGIAKAQSGWMTEDFVPFELELKFEIPENKPKYGVMVFKKDNPSGLPEHDDELNVPVYFK